MGKFGHTPYYERTDVQKAETQWGKALGLLRRNDWSAAIVRAVTAAEISLNLAIRREYADRAVLKVDDVNQLLHRANGVHGKLTMLKKLLGDDDKKWVEQLRKLIKNAAHKRNRIVHSGEFCGEAEACNNAERCREFVDVLIKRYEPEFKLTSDEITPQEDLGA